MAVEDFSEHVDQCNVSFKQAIMEKVKALKQTDETILTERVSVAIPTPKVLTNYYVYRLKSSKDKRAQN